MSKRLLLLFSTCFLLLTKLSVAQAPNWLWVEGSGGGNWEYGYGISSDPLYNIFIDGRCANTMTLGGLSATAGGGTSPFMEELDSSGKGKWIAEETYSGGFDYTEGFYRDNKDNTYSTGIINGGLDGMFIDKYNNAGILQWSVTIPNGINGSGITADNSGNVYVTGIFTSGSYTFGSTTLSYSGSYNAIFLTQLDSNGNFIWAQSIYGTGSADGSDNGRDILTDNNGNIYFCGDYTGSPVFGTVTAPAGSGVSDFFIAKYDTGGNTQWVTTATNSLAGTFGGSNDLSIDSCGNLYATGAFANTAQFGNITVTSAGGNDIFVAQCNNNGQWQWVQSAGGAGNDAGSAIALDKYNYVYVAGNFANSFATFGFGSMSLSAGDVFVAKYANSNGAIQWVQGATASGGIRSITVDNSNYVYATGGFRYYAKFGADSVPATSTENIFIAKLDTVANRTIAAIFDSVYCPRLYEPLPYTTSGTFNSNNIFTAQLSDSTGSFVSTVTIGSATSTTGGIINVKIPNGTPTGSHYHIRIVSSNPATSSTVSCNSYISIGKSLQFTLFGDTTICKGSSAKLSISGGSTYLWSTGDTTATIMVTPLKDSTFTIEVGNGICTKDTFVSVTVSTPPVLTIQPQSLTICNGDSILFTASGSTSYSWSNDDTTNSIVLKPVKDTTYNISVSNGYCITDTSISITVLSIPAPAIQPAIPIICNGGNIELTASGGSSYLWSTGDTTATITVASLKDSTYTVSVSNGVCSRDTFVRVIVSTPPIVTFQPQSLTICNGDSIVFTASGSSSYTWSNSDTTSSITIYPIKDTTYDISVSNGFCSSDISAIVKVVNAPVPVIQPSTPVICNAGSIELTASGGLSYLWSTGDTSATITVSPVKDSSFIVSVSNGICSRDTFVMVIIDTPAVLVIQPQSPTVCNGQSVTLSTNNVESSFAWSPSGGLDSASTDSTIATPVATTTYTLNCSDSLGCSSSGTVVVTVDSCSIVWPGDTNDDSVANNYDLIPIGIYYRDTGIPRDSISNTWLPHLASNWNAIQYNGLNKKHVDCNGDGIINSDDTLAIYLNYGLTHNLPMKGYSPDTIQETVPFYFTADSSSYYPGSPVHISVWLGTLSKQATMLYALGYDIGLKTSLLKPNTLAFNYVKSFIGTKNSDALTLTHLNNDVETAVTRIDHLNTTGYGKIGDLYFMLSSSIKSTQYRISFTSYQAVDSAGNPIIFQPANDTLIIHQVGGIGQLSANSEQLSIYPNPTSDKITIVCGKNIDELKVTNVLGQLIYELQPKQPQINFDLKDDGIYFITISSNNETVTRKVLVTK